MALGDGLNNAAVAGLIRAFARCPMADRTPRRLRGLTGQGDELAPLLCTEGSRSPGAWGVWETLGHGTAGACEPVATPAPDCGACRVEATGHVRCRQALRQQEDPVGSEAQVWGRLRGTNQRVERVALRLGQWHSRRLRAR